MGMNYLFYTDQLQGEFKKAFDQVELYGSVHNIDGENTNKKKKDLVSAMIQAQKDEEPLQTVIGEDFDGFCKKFYADFGFKERMASFAAAVYRISVIIIIFELISLVLGIGDSEFHLFTATSDVTGFIMGVLEASLLLWFIRLWARRKTFPLNHITSKAYNWFSILFLLVICFVSMYFMPDNLISVPLILEFAVTIAYALLYKGIILWKRKQITGSIKKPADETPSMHKEFQNSMKYELPKAFIKRYERINLKRILKGKEPLTNEEFMTKLTKENRRLKYYCSTAIVVFVIALTAFVLNVTKADPLSDRLTFAGIILVLELPIIYFFFFRYVIGRDARSKLFKELDALQVDVFEYVEILRTKE